MARQRRRCGRLTDPGWVHRWRGVSCRLRPRRQSASARVPVWILSWRQRARRDRRQRCDHCRGTRANRTIFANPNTAEEAVAFVDALLAEPGVAMVEAEA